MCGKQREQIFVAYRGANTILIEHERTSRCVNSG